MGYYVSAVTSNLKFNKKYEMQAREKWIELDKKDHLKRGGSDGKKPERWFSWMNWWDSETYSVKETLDLLGFKLTEDEEFIYINHYDSKRGQEQLFLETIEEFLEGRMIMEGEDGMVYTMNYDFV